MRKFVVLLTAVLAVMTVLPTHAHADELARVIHRIEKGCYLLGQKYPNSRAGKCQLPTEGLSKSEARWIENIGDRCFKIGQENIRMALEIQEMEASGYSQTEDGQLFVQATNLAIRIGKSDCFSEK